MVDRHRASGSRAAVERPINAWLLIGDDASYPTSGELRQLTGRRRAQTQSWTGPKHAQRGDLLFFYFMAPTKMVCFAARCLAPAEYRDDLEVRSHRDVDQHQWWVSYNRLVTLERVPLATMRDLMGGKLILRGRQSRYLPPTVAEHLLKPTWDRGNLLPYEEQILQIPVGDPTLPEPGSMTLTRWRGMADGAFVLERPVEQYVVEPLLRMALRGDAEVRPQYPTPVGVPDFAVLRGDRVVSVVEVKLAIRGNRQLTLGEKSSPDVAQTLRYARHLDVPAVLMDTQHIGLFPRGASRASVVLERSSFSADNLEQVRQLLLDL